MDEQNQIQLLSDSVNVISVIKKTGYNQTTKWINLHYHFIKDCLQKDLVSLNHIDGASNLSDILTKSLAAPCFTELQQYMLSDHSATE